MGRFNLTRCVSPGCDNDTTTRHCPDCSIGGRCWSPTWFVSVPILVAGTCCTVTSTATTTVIEERNAMRHKASQQTSLGTKHAGQGGGGRPPLPLKPARLALITGSLTHAGSS